MTLSQKKTRTNFTYLFILFLFLFLFFFSSVLRPPRRPRHLGFPTLAASLSVRRPGLASDVQQLPQIARRRWVQRRQRRAALAFGSGSQPKGKALGTATRSSQV